MARKNYYFSGIAKWAKVQEPQDNFDKTGKEYSIDLYLNPESLALFQESELRIKLYEDEDGKYVKFRRPETKIIKEEAVELGKPKVMLNDGTEIDDLVGNGSEVVCKVSVYDTRMGKGHQLEAVRVDNLVEYTGEPEEIGIEEPF